jgi:CRISPR-associated protein Cas1
MRHKPDSLNAHPNGGDDFEYTDRSEYWRTYRKPQIGPGRYKKYRYREPLILCGHGIRIRVDHNSLLVRNGFTHYPQKQEEVRFFPGDGNLPDRIIILDASGGISFDALEWMGEQKIEFLQLNWKGNIATLGSSTGYSAKANLVEAQDAVQRGSRRLDIIKWLLGQKMERCISTLNDLALDGESRDKAVARIGVQLAKLHKLKYPTPMPSIMGTEGQSAAAYFRALEGIPLNWANLKKRPVPQDWSKTVPRGMAWRDRARSARHPVNAMFNYGYGILVSQLRSQVIAAGLDPSIGIFHGSSGNKIPLVYDLMEPLRPIVDQAVLQFALSHTFAPGDFAITKWGGCRLNPQMAKVVATRIGEIKTDNVPAFISQLRGMRR